MPRGKRWKCLRVHHLRPEHCLRPFTGLDASLHLVARSAQHLQIALPELLPIEGHSGTGVLCVVSVSLRVNTVKRQSLLRATRSAAAMQYGHYPPAFAPRPFLLPLAHALDPARSCSGKPAKSRETGCFSGAVWQASCLKARRVPTGIAMTTPVKQLACQPNSGTKPADTPLAWRVLVIGIVRDFFRLSALMVFLRRVIRSCTDS